jgi:acyl-coenzyme A synthetase/AMP-(fatty) acid ligase
MVTEEEIAQFVAVRVAKVKRLTGGVVFVPAIPKTPVSFVFALCHQISDETDSSFLSQSGKILRRELKERAGRPKVHVATRARI